VEIAKLLLGVRSESLRGFGRNSSETDSETVSGIESETDSKKVLQRKQIQKTDSEPVSKQIQNQKTESVIRVRDQIQNDQI
jgi:hypothetical protein